MKVPLYVLGFLLRYGPLHGYKLKQLISEQVSDFTNIKLPNIYYHLDKMQSNKYVTVNAEQIGKRPERGVYKITERGKEFFLSLLEKNLYSDLKLEFNLDAVLFFYKYLDKNEFNIAFEKHEHYLERVIRHIEEHKKQVLPHIPEPMNKIVEKLFEHHFVHYKAELEWLKGTKETINQALD